MTRQQTLENLIKPVVEAMGYEFVGAEYHAQGRYSVLRIYIDKPDGVTLDNCGQVSQQLSAVLDVEDPIADRYTLEISSPGLDRPLLTLAHFEQFQGETAKVHLYAPIDHRRNFTGIIEQVDEENVSLNEAGQTVTIPFSAISKANLVYHDGVQHNE